MITTAMNGHRSPQHIQRQLRIIGILNASRRAGLSPLALGRLHTIAYFADALAPVWDLRILDAQLLKLDGGPMSPVLQRDVDRLVGQGVVVATNTKHARSADGKWRLEADYDLNRQFSDPILVAAAQYESQEQHLAFVEEVVFAVSALSEEGIDRATAEDEAYSNPLVDVDGLLDLRRSGTDRNLSERLARRFGEVMRPEVDLTSAEMVHLYVRHIQQRLQDVA